MRRTPKRRDLPFGPRLSPTTRLRRLGGAALSDDVVYTDVDIVPPLERGIAKNVNSSGRYSAMSMYQRLACAGAAELRGSTLDDLKMRAGDLAGAVIDPVQLVALARTLATLSGIVVRHADDDPGA